MEFIVVFDRMWCLAWPGLDYWRLILKSDVLVSIIQSVLKIGSRLYATRQHVIINHTVKIPNRVLSSSTPNHTDLAQNLAFWWVLFMRKASLLCLEISICLTVGNSNKVLNNELMEPREPLSKPLASLQPSPDNTQVLPPPQRSVLSSPSLPRGGTFLGTVSLSTHSAPLETLLSG